MTPPVALPIVAVLAGGQSRRMQGADKALAMIAGQRMIDRVLARLAPQAGTLLLSAGQDYGTGLGTVADGPLGPAGPVGAIRALAEHVAATGADRFVTVPVDAPFVPCDLVARLAAGNAMARSMGTWQPAFACWHSAAVLAALPPQLCAQKWSLRRLGQALAMQAVDFDDPNALMNVNTPDDLAIAQQQADRS